MSKLSKEEQANIYLRELKEVIGDDWSTITTIFSVIKRSVGEDYYFDVINACCKEVLESKKKGINFNTDETVRGIYSETGFTRENEVPIQSLSIEEQAYSNDRELCAEIIRNRIFSDILNGKDKSILAIRYSTTEDVIDSIYTEQLAKYTIENNNTTKKHNIK